MSAGVDALVKLEELTQDQPKAPLRPHQVTAYEEERDRLHGIVNAPAFVTGANRGDAANRYRQLNKMLKEQAPRRIDGDQRRDAVARAADDVLNEIIKPAMLPQSVMRRNPAGAVDEYFKREGSKGYKRAVTAWRRAQLGLHPDADERDLTNVERFRDPGNGDGTSTFMTDAQIGGHLAMTALAKARWPLGEPTVETPLATARKRDAKPKKNPLYEKSEAERKAWGEKMAAARAAKKAQAEAGPAQTATL